MAMWELRPITFKPPEEYLRLSASSVGRYEKCPMSWRLQYRDKVGPAMKGSYSLTFGNVVHDALKSYNRAWLGTGVKPADSELGDFVVDAVRAYNVPPHEHTPTVAAVMKLISKYHHEISDIEPTICEHKFWIVNVAEEIAINGFLDLATIDSVLDYKTSFSPVRDLESYRDQLELYAHVFKLITLQLPTHIRVVNFVRSKGAVTPHELKWDRSTRVLDKISTIRGKIAESNFEPKPGAQCKDCLYAAQFCEAGRLRNAPKRKEQ